MPAVEHVRVSGTFYYVDAYNEWWLCLAVGCGYDWLMLKPGYLVASASCLHGEALNTTYFTPQQGFRLEFTS